MPEKKQKEAQHRVCPVMGGKQSSNQFVNNLINEVPGDVYWKDMNGVYLGMNRQGVKNLKKMGFLTDESVIGKTDYDLFGKHIADRFRDNDLQVMRDNKKYTTEESAILPSGEKKTQLSSKSPLYNEKGETIGIIGNTIDISYQREIENNLIKANNIKAEFIANMSHDLRTPMTGILGMFAELKHLAFEITENPKQSQLLAKEMIKHVEMGEGSSNVLLSLFNEILDSIHLESGRVTREAEHFNLRAAIQSNIDLLRPMSHKKGLTQILSIDDEMPIHFWGIRRLLDRVLLNLISNATKFTSQGEVRVNVSLVSEGAAEVGEQALVQISIADTGIGIVEDKLEEIFENFSKLSSSYEDTNNGYGLGLYAVKQYVEILDGSIEVESVVGTGSTFVITIPLIVSDVHEQKEKGLFGDLGKTPYTSKTVAYDGAAVLVVEDSAAAALAIISALKRFGCEVVHVKTGPEAISVTRDSHFDLILMDVGLPGLSGLDATKEIRSFSATPVIALTGHIDKEVTCLEAGMQGLLAKPASAEDLESVLYKHIPHKFHKK